MSAQPLDLLRMPLSGVGLVEASAGTGKTFSIAWLYLRLLLERNFQVEQILVVTFTEAAAEELRERLRRRLAWACAVLSANVDPHPDDRERERLYALIAQCEKSGVDQATQQQALLQALQNFDRASIFTIHGWCRRVLTDHALQTGVSLGRFDIANADPLKRSIVEDVWRRELHQDEEHAAWLLQCFATPAHLFQSIQGLFTLPTQAFDPADPQAQLQLLQQRQQAAARAFTIACADSARCMELLFDKRFGISTDEKKGYKPAQVSRLLQDMAAWIGGGRIAWPAPADLVRFEPDFFRNSQTESAIRQGKPLPDHPLIDALLVLAEVQAKIIRMQRAKLLRQTVLSAQRELQQREDASAVYGYDALIGRVHDALTVANGDKFAAHLRERYPVALVDEFQDTDQQQFAIFRALYADAGSLLMIGDAKQSIYRFRGGDVFAYGQARNLAKSQLCTLTTNYRSEPRLVSAVNVLFAAKDNFIYDFIEWQNVAALGPRNGAFLTPNPHPLVVWHAPVTEATAHSSHNSPINSTGKLAKAVATAVADEIVRLLASGADNELVLDGHSVRAGDIAVLVNTHDQAALIERSLQVCNVAASTLSRESVYASAQARDLLSLVQAMLNPRRGSYLRAALSTETVGWNAKLIAELLVDPVREERVHERFQALAAVWQADGPIALIEELMHEFSAHCLIYADGQRRIANFRHLGELLNELSNAGYGAQEQAEQLERYIQCPNPENDAERLRRASDADAVQIVTIHASKGLEYPIVFAPFLWQATRGIAKQAPVVSHHPEDLRVVVDLGSDAFESRAELAARENYAEAMRRAYVACTRAINRLYLVWGKIADAQYSPCARLFHGVPPDGALLHSQYLQLDDAALQTQLQQLANASDGAITVCGMPERLSAPWQADTTSLPLSAREFTRDVTDRRSIHSFTRIIAGTSDGGADQRRFLNSSMVGDEGFSITLAEQAPRGALLGECLHAILQQIDFQNPDDRLARNLIAEVSERYGFDRDVVALFRQWIKRLLNTELVPGLALAGVPANRLIKEMEFHFALESSTRESIGAIANRFGDYADALAVLAQTPTGLHGWMHGYIDLIVENQGRFFVLDYKSNYLGGDEADYAPDRLAATMQSHRYDLQLVIYLLALHRYLALRLGPQYEPETNLGGALCVFVRGVKENVSLSGVQVVQPPVELILALDRCFGDRRRFA